MRDSPKIDTLIGDMLKAIDGYRRREMPLSKLTWELKSRISEIESTVDAEWGETLRSDWWDIEYVNASALDSSQPELTEREASSVDLALDQLRRHLRHPGQRERDDTPG